MTSHFGSESLAIRWRGSSVPSEHICGALRSLLSYFLPFFAKDRLKLPIMYRNYLNIVSGDLKDKLSLRKLNGVKKIFKRKMETEFVTVNNVPIRVDSWGGYSPSKILERSQQKPKELILMIPGNPGVTRFYEKFLNLLHEKTRKPIWILSHGGHDKTSKRLPSLRKNPHLYDLRGQIDQKNKFIETYLEGVTLYCVGHSIGCKMLLEVLKTERKSTEIEKCIMLFPALERMAETPNGVYVRFVINYILWLTLFGSWIFAYLPKLLQVVLLRTYCFVMKIPYHNIPAMWQLIDPHVLNKVFFLADDEMKTVKELDDEALKLHGHKIKLYYGAKDGWTPLKYYRELAEKHKDIDAEVCSKGYQHTFVLKESQQMADLVSTWLTK